jgi:hypothetical protein
MSLAHDPCLNFSIIDHQPINDLNRVPGILGTSRDLLWLTIQQAFLNFKLSSLSGTPDYIMDYVLR